MRLFLRVSVYQHLNAQRSLEKLKKYERKNLAKGTPLDVGPIRDNVKQQGGSTSTEPKAVGASPVMHGGVGGAEGDGVVSQGPTPVRENAHGEFSSVGALADGQVNQEVNVSATVSEHAEGNTSSEVFMSYAPHLHECPCLQHGIRRQRPAMLKSY